MHMQEMVTRRVASRRRGECSSNKARRQVTVATFKKWQRQDNHKADLTFFSDQSLYSCSPHCRHVLPHSLDG